MSKDSGEPKAWIITVLGLWVLASPFVLGITGTYRISLIATGAIVAVLATWRAVQPDDKVPLPMLPMAVIILGLWTLASPFLLGSGLDTHGITMIVSGIVFIVMPAMMINQMISEEASATGETTG